METKRRGGHKMDSSLNKTGRAKSAKRGFSKRYLDPSGSLRIVIKRGDPLLLFQAMNVEIRLRQEEPEEDSIADRTKDKVWTDEKVKSDLHGAACWWRLGVSQL
ncbi:hypothetical protein KY290_001271 [Solanum tuberosum]|uniref:Uncharacterized protein n=1 Tax=Solanum tuberosum TaxID=4113 RepID=A0ABQ7WLR8_SOLTU|nr:hypothetical protein KY290_001271 [Solanum tuberosum]